MKPALQEHACVSGTEFDPLGADLTLSAPPDPPPGEGPGDVGVGHFGGIMDKRWSDFFNLESGFTENGFSMSTSEAMFYLNFGTGRKLMDNIGVTGKDVANALGASFALPGLPFATPGVEGISGRQTIEYEWVKSDGSWIKIPVPTAYSGSSAIPGSIVTLASSVHVQQPPAQNSVSASPAQQRPIWCQRDVIKAMNDSWSRSGNAGMSHPGSQPIEAAFNLNGTPSNYQIDQSFTNQLGKMDIKYNTLANKYPTFANFHIHTRGFDGTGLPSTPGNNYEGDGKGDTGHFDDIYKQTNKQQAIQVFVMSWHGLSMYDPATGKSTQLVQGTGFLKGEGCPP